MALDAQAQAVADAFAQLPAPDLSVLTADEMRAMVTAFPPPPAIPTDVVASIADQTLDTATVPLKIRVYRPQADGPLPLTVYFHGGGFVCCGLDTHDNVCQALAARAASVVISVDYRLAPESPFPAAVDDAVAAVRAIHARAGSFGADPARIAVAGDSAGGNLAAVVAQQLRGTGPALCHQLLLYPTTDSACDTASQREITNAPMLSADIMRWYWRQYLPDARDGLDPRASPLRQTDMTGLPAATVITAEVDPLRDEGEAYAQAMAAAGVPVTLRRWPGQFHGFSSMLGALDAASASLDFAAGRLAECFHRS